MVGIVVGCCVGGFVIVVGGIIGCVACAGCCCFRKKNTVVNVPLQPSMQAQLYTAGQEMYQPQLQLQQMAVQQAGQFQGQF